MTILDFQVLCGKFNITPAMALENEKIVNALGARDDKEVRRLLETEV